MGFKVRKWSSTNERPFDVVYEDHTFNNVHYQPQVEFSTEEMAEAHRVELVGNFSDAALSFIRDHWPTDGEIVPEQ